MKKIRKKLKQFIKKDVENINRQINVTITNLSNI